jgi:hypothetical protein
MFRLDTRQPLFNLSEVDPTSYQYFPAATGPFVRPYEFLLLHLFHEAGSTGEAEAQLPLEIGRGNPLPAADQPDGILQQTISGLLSFQAGPGWE